MKMSVTRKFRIKNLIIISITCAISFGFSTLWCFHSCDSLLCSERNCQKMIKLNPVFGKTMKISNSDETDHPLLIVLIFSSVYNLEQRDTIRQTWLKNSGREIIHFFVIGSGKLGSSEEKTLASENTRFSDLLLLPDVVDSYNTLTQKLKSSLIKLIEEKNFKFVLKVDDDSFVQLELLFNELYSLKSQNRLYWGYFDGRATVKKLGHWKEIDWNLCDRYIPYALGGGYVISRDLVEYIYINEKLLKLFNSEDVSLGTWLAPLDIRRFHDPRFDTEYKSRGCSNSFVVSHKQSMDEMREKYRLFEENGKICSREIQLRLPYKYNWKVPPSKCCIRTNDTNNRQ